MANYWRSKYPRVGWCVFPDCAWEIEDLWDAEDIHIYTPKLCSEALQFLGHDNVWTAKKFAEDWARAHPEHLAATFGKSSMAAMYDPAQPLDLVDNIFIFGEANLFPRQFLYYAADMLRTAMLEDEARKNCLVATPNITSPPVASIVPDKQQEAVEALSASKKNRKKSRSRPQTLTVSTEPAARQDRRQELPIPHVENFPRGVHAPRVPSGPFPPVHPPHMNHIAITMGPTMGPGQLHMASFQHHPAHLPHPGTMHSGMLPPHHIHPGYTQQVPVHRGLRGVSMRDMTNAAYSANPRPPYMDAGRSGRRERSLYDPYNGSRPAFNDYGGGRKTSRGSFTEQPGRKASVQGPRPRIGSNGTDWGETASNSNRFSDYRYSRHHMKDDPIITNDAVRGCGQTWIGPENHDVTELFIGELPENTQPNQIESMFLHLVNVTPVRAVIKIQPGAQRGHAFVMFNDASDAKLALRANDSEPHIHGTRLRITVPRRFFQKADDYSHPPQRVPSTTLKPTGTAVTSSTSATQPLYTSQDARSDLQKEATEMHKTMGTQQVPSHAEGKETEMRKTTETQKAPSPELSPEVKTPVIDAIAEKAESPIQSNPQSSKTVEEATESLSSEDDHDSKTIAAEPHVDAEKPLSRASSPQPTTTAGHARVESPTKATFEETESSTEELKAVEAAIMKVSEPSKEDHEATKTDSEGTAEPVALQAAAPVSSPDIKVVLGDPQRPVEVAKSTSYADAVKQQGPPQAQSLHPFAKPSKSQREKTKKMKKKEQKRENKNAQTDVVQDATSAQGTNAASSIEVPEEAQVKVPNTGSTEDGSEYPGSGITSEPQEVLSTVSKSELDSRPDSDGASVASSATLHAPADRQPSPSPEAEDYHTPLQTPTIASTPQQDELPKRKKKKNKNKKKKSATAVQAEAGTSKPQIAEASEDYTGHGHASGSFTHQLSHIDQVRAATKDPVHQLSHIDKVRAATKDPTTYYNIVNREMEARNKALSAAPKAATSNFFSTGS